MRFSPFFLHLWCIKMEKFSYCIIHSYSWFAFFPSSSPFILSSSLVQSYFDFNSHKSCFLGCIAGFTLLFCVSMKRKAIFCDIYYLCNCVLMEELRLLKKFLRKNTKYPLEVNADCINEVEKVFSTINLE